MKEIVLRNHDKKVIIDDDMYEVVTRLDWRFSFDKNKVVSASKNKRICLARYIFGEQAKSCVFLHKNKNIFDFTKENLVLAKKSVQHKKTIGKFKGVSFHKKANKYRAYFSAVGRGQKHLGLFNSEVEAAKAYNKFAIEVFGENAVLNEIPDATN